MVVLMTFLAVFTMAARVSMDSDTWWHLRAGQWILDHRQILMVDQFSYTRAGEPWKYPGWLIEVPMFLIYQRFGPGGFNILTALVITLTFVFVWQTLTGGPFLRAFIIIFAAIVSGIYWAARPYLITFLLSVVFLWVLEDYRLGRVNRLWLLPILMVIWANSHGGFIIGFIIWAVYLIGQLEHIKLTDLHGPGIFNYIKTLLPLIFIGLGLVIAVCINPSGPIMLLYGFKTVSIKTLRDYIQEWQSPNFHELRVQPFIWMLVITFGAVGFSRKRLALTDFLLVAGFAYMSLTSARNIAIFALVTPLVLTRYGEPVLKRYSKLLKVHVSTVKVDDVSPRRQVLNWMILGVLAIACVIKVSLVLPPEVNWAVIKKTMPVEAVNFIKLTKPSGQLLNSYNWGGYLIWALPEYPVFIDGRTDLYNDEIISQWLQVVQAENGWQQVLDRWGVKLIILEPDRPVVAQLDSNGWKRIYTDNTAVVYKLERQ
jgi:hypothetical protein